MFITGAISGIIGGILLATYFISNSAALDQQLMTAALVIPIGTSLGFSIAFTAIVLIGISKNLR